MKLIKKISVFVVMLALVITMVGCDKSKAVEAAYEKKEYTVAEQKGSDLNALWTSGLDEDQKAFLADCSIIVATSGLNLAVIVKFPSAKDIKKFLTTEDEDGKKDTSAYTSAKDDNKIYGNCYLLFSLGNGTAIFEKL